MKLVVKATLRSPYGNKVEHYIDPDGCPVRRNVTVTFTGSRDRWRVLGVGMPEKLPAGYDYWTVTKVVE